MPTIKQLNSLIKIAELKITDLSRESGVSTRTIHHWLSNTHVTPKSDSFNNVCTAAVRMARAHRDKVLTMEARLAEVGVDLGAAE